jgi:8-oxo-dGTP pyrophosphatase MutT (NUDIX family)
MSGYRGEDDLAHRLAARLDALDGPPQPAARSDFDLNPQFHPGARTLKPAAVLAPIVRRPQGWTMLLTQRTADMPTHAGQIAFPGGRIQPEDAGPVAAALRETEEEVGIAASFITPIGAIPPYETVTGFSVTPIIGFVEPGFELKPDPREVADVFEAPLSFLLDPANHERHSREWQGGTRAYYVMPWQNRFIWGATAGMIKLLYDRLYADED